MGEIAVKRDLSKADDDAQMPELSEFRVQMHGAVADLLRSRLVSWRGAANHRCDPGFAKLESILARHTLRLICKAGLVENRVHEVTGSVAGERSAGSVGSMGAGGEAENQHAGARITKTRHGPCPVGLIPVRAALRLSDPFAVRAKTGALFTADDLLMNVKKICR